MSVAPEQSTATINIDDDVDLLTEQIQAVNELGRHDDVSDDEIYDVSIRWGSALAGRLSRLVHYSALGMLADADERRFQSLCTQLRGMSELIDRFDLAPVVFVDSAPATARRHGAARQSSSRRGHLFHRR